MSGPRPTRRTWGAVVALGTLGLAASSLAQPLAAQPASVVLPYTPGATVERLDGEAESRRRLEAVSRGHLDPGWVFRRSSAPVLNALPASGWRVLLPWGEWGRNRALPSGGNDGPVWAGRGALARVSPGGIAVSEGPLRLVFAPEYAWSRNEAYAFLEDPWWAPPVVPPLSPYAMPANVSQWTGSRYSADVPWRMGEAQVRSWHPGASGAWLRGGGVEVGLTAENEWWGPAYRNALVLSANAPGIPRVAIRTPAPLRVAGGALQFSVGMGNLMSSGAFLVDRAPITGTWTGAMVAYTPDGAPGFTVGMARAIYAGDNAHRPLAQLGRLVGSVGRPATEATLDTTFAGGVDQVASLFARWVPPGGGTELYAEVGRAEQPASWRDLWVDPDHSAALTVGAVRVLSTARARWRLQAELTTAEQTATFRHRPQGSWYTSPVVRQGYTHQGQTLGAAVGPGGSAQYLAIERVTAATSLGVFAHRARLNQDAFYTYPWPAATEVPAAQGWCEWDTPTQVGLTAAWVTPLGVLHGSAAWERRFNVFWQNNAGCPTTPDKQARDVAGAVLRIGWSAGLAPRATSAEPRRRRMLSQLAMDGPFFDLGHDTQAGANSEAERIGRMQALLSDEPHAWSLRPFAPAQRSRVLPVREAGGFRVVPLTLGLTYNSTFAYGILDGPLWTGRGPTAWASGGVALRLGPLRAVVAPTVFRAANQAFATLPSGRTGAAQFSDPITPTWVDLPQRFGTGAYGRADWGQSSLRLDVAGLGMGVTTEGQWWGPAAVFPLLVSTNAPGIPRLFVGTSTPWRTWLGTVQAQWQWGDLRSSGFFDTTGIARPRRFGTGLIAVFEPRGLDGLEVGLARYFHARWPNGAVPQRYWLRAVEGFLKASRPTLPDAIGSDDRSRDGENQVASVFFRWKPRVGGTEFYGELARDDASWDLRDALIAPTQLSAIMAGVAHGWRTAGGIAALRLEAMSGGFGSNDRRRHIPVLYTHATGSNQGHTVMGQLMGPPTGVGNTGGAALQFDHASEYGGRTSVGLMRLLRRRRASILGDGVHDVRATDAQYVLSVERRRGLSGLHTLGAAWVWNANRDFGADRSNLQLWVQWSPPWR